MSRVQRWIVLSATTPSRDLMDLVAEGFFALGAGGVLEEGDSRIAYLPAEDDPEQVVARAREAIESRLPPGVSLRLDWHWQPEQDWIALWKSGLRPRVVTDRLIVKPTWTEWASEPGHVVIDLDPQMAFGTGEHATTRGCLRLLDRAIRTGARVLDVGSGSGILAIAAARLGAADVVAIEYDPDANLNARENLALNGVVDAVRIVEAEATDERLGELGAFDLVLANILSGVILPLLPAFRAALRADGHLIVGGILATEALRIQHAAEQAGFRIEAVDAEEEWWSALLVVRAGS